MKLLIHAPGYGRYSGLSTGTVGTADSGCHCTDKCSNQESTNFPYPI